MTVTRPLLLALLMAGCAADSAPDAGPADDPNADQDGDGLSDADEAASGSDPTLADTDADGLDDADEAASGSDPTLADTDADGLGDAEELEAGTDPTMADSDGDTYRDSDEIREGHDPLDPEDRIHLGYWPYNPNKEAVVEAPWTGLPLQIGDTFGPIRDGVDQFGEPFDLRDYAHRDRLIVIDSSATWCGPCMMISTWLSEGPANDPYNLDEDDRLVRLAVGKGEVQWITFMTDNGTSGEITLEDVQWWSDSFPHDRIPVVADVDQRVLLGVNVDGDFLVWPWFVVLDQDLKVLFVGPYQGAMSLVNQSLL